MAPSPLAGPPAAPRPLSAILDGAQLPDATASGAALPEMFPAPTGKRGDPHPHPALGVGLLGQGGPKRELAFKEGLQGWVPGRVPQNSLMSKIIVWEMGRGGTFVPGTVPGP